MAAVGQVLIANLALSALGTRSTIADLGENSAEAAQAQLHYDQARTSVLRAAHWNFARTQAALALLKDGTLVPAQSVPQPWLYEYAYPNDCVRARYVMPQFIVATSAVPGSASPSTVQVPTYGGRAVRWLAAQDQDAQGNSIRVILTNQPQAILVYTRDEPNTQLFDNDFVDALALYLAARMAIALTGDKGLRDRLVAEANSVCLQAQKTNGNEGITVIDSVPDWISVRGYASDWGYPPGSALFMEPQALNMIA